MQKIRYGNISPDEQKSWKDKETYLSETEKVKLTHGLCPACLEKELDSIDRA